MNCSRKIRLPLIFVLLGISPPIAAEALDFFRAWINDRDGEILTDYGYLVTRLSHNTQPGLVSMGAVLIASRSLQQDYTDLADPRNIVSIAPASPDLPVPVFLAHAAKAKQIEVISWNPEKLRYEFLTILSYGAGEIPRIAEAPRALCVSCHQNEGPIFPREPWDESDSSAKVRNLLMPVRKVVPTGFGGFSAGFDARVRKANRVLQAMRVCRELCDDDRDCRRQLLGLALLGSSRLTEPATVAQLNETFSRVVENRWPEHGFAFPSSVIPDRDGLIDADKGGVTTLHVVTDKERFFQSPEVRRLLHDDADRAEKLMADTRQGYELTYEEDFAAVSLEQLPFIKSVQFTGKSTASNLSNPRLPRPKTSALVLKTAAATLKPHLGGCFGFADEDHRMLEGLPAARITDVVFKAPNPAIEELISGAWPPSRTDAIQRVKRAFALRR